MGKPVEDFVTILRAIYRLLRWMLWGSVALVALIFVGQIFTYYQMFAGIHVALGWLFLVAVAALVWWLVGLPVVRFMRVPVAVLPPEMPGRDSGLAPKHLVKRLNFVERHLGAQRRNPLLEEQQGEIDAAIGELTMLRERVAGRGDGGLDESLREIAAFETKRVEPILQPLDAEAEKVIRAEALGVGVATAVALNGTLDALIVLWRNANMISRIARIYYGRPGPRGSLVILRDVSTTVLISNYLENVTDYAGSLLGKWMGGVAGVVAGPLLNGGANAVMTLRMGYLAKARCRSFQAWTDEHRRSMLMQCLQTAKDASVSVLTELTRQVGGAMGGVAAGAVYAGSTLYKGAKGTVKTAKDLFTGDLFRRGKDEEPGEEGEEPAT